MALDVKEIHLPKTIGVWTRPESPQVIDSKNIFEYMDGAGELYLGYRFHDLQVFEYVSDNQDSILVELYRMETSDDAFGLLSLDWGGEPLTLSGSPPKPSNQSPPSSTRALYGEGLLRIWSDHLYARVMAYQETPASKRAVLTLGQAIVANRKNPPEPALTKTLLPQIGSTWKLRQDRLSYFRSYLVLNSIYYISDENILDLDLSTEAVTAPYEPISIPDDPKRSRFLLVKYGNPDRARKALNHFHDAYLPEHRKAFTAKSTVKTLSFFKLEDGWLAYQWFDRYIAMVFECPDQESARSIIQKNETHVREKEGLRER